MKNLDSVKKEQPENRHALVLIATPIGNLEDISIRAIKELSNADLICCEDTRRTGKLLQLLEIKPRPDLFVLNEHTELTKSAEIIERIRNGQRVALVSDAGLPGISDPGEHIVKEAIQKEVTIEVIPGPSAGITALVASGLPTTRYVFQGFIPRKGKARKERLHEISEERKTTVLYESGNRLKQTIEDLKKTCGNDRQISVAKELTKIHEEFVRGTLSDVNTKFQSRNSKGEYVIVIGGRQESGEATDEELLDALKEFTDQGKSDRDAVKETVKKFNVSKRRVYELSIENP
ncbi:MAG: 16S rRNA (cytidine(1402)-2'-O)-methyltransferase [Acidimicrobiales bacterium]|nr:16S rRNA (cytidine(1402)-2'-O)-methyltransferase [Acidimicrobiales bacterium]MDP6297964.1 16S rRNA (cytidine(1402)-2'-O)-methyltransferase [Acidimicrobiales bacterium]